MQEHSQIPVKPERPAGVKKGRYFAVYSKRGGYRADLINTKLSRHGFFLPDDIVPEKLPLAETPRFRLRGCSPEKPPRDFQQLAGLWFLSDRAKRVFEEADPDAFVFVRCETEYRGGEVGPDLWICNVIRVIDPLDRENSQFKVIDYGAGGYAYELSGSLYRSYRDDIVANALVFRLEHLEGYRVSNNRFSEICKSENLSGMMFNDEVEI